MLLCLGLGLVITGQLQAQHDHDHDHPSSYCGSDAVNKAVYDANPDLYQALADLNQYVHQQVQSNKTAVGYQYPGYEGGTRFVIPIVVHIFWGRELGKIDSISAEQIESQIIGFFDSYRKVPGTLGWGGQGVDTQIEFALATKDPSGQPTPGYRYIFSPALSDANQQEQSDIFANYAWDRTKYLNVFLVGTINGTSTLGYAFLPQPNMGQNDGTLIMIKTWGNQKYLNNGGFFLNQYEHGKTAVHELGHALGLLHTFGPSDSNGCGGDCRSSGDFVCDTPPTEGQNFGNGLERQNTCNNDNPDKPDNPANNMDYLVDLASNYFSAGQTLRMHGVLQNATYRTRYPLWQPQNMTATGVGPFKAPRANFWAFNANSCVNAPIQLTDYSMSIPTKYKWIIPGATFLTPDTAGNPIVQFATPGSYDVTLIVNNFSNQPDTLTKVGYLVVNDTVYSLPHHETFNAFGPGIAPNWVVDNEDKGKYSGAFTWEKTRNEGAFDTSAACVRLDHFQYADYGQRDGLLTPAFDFSSAQHGSLAFSWAYRPTRSSAGGFNLNTIYADSLRILASTDCGNTWTPVFYKGGVDLMTAASIPTAVTRFNNLTAADWKRDTISIDQFAGESSVRFKFEAINGFGNLIYLDDVVVDTLPVQADTIPSSAAPRLPDLGLTIAPNPFMGTTHLHFALPTPDQVLVEVLDITGKVVYNHNYGWLPAGVTDLDLTLPNPAAGMYLFRITTAGQTLTHKLICAP